MNRTARTLDPETQIHRLESRHSDLKSRVNQLDRRAILTAQEQFEITKLKREKLAIKDEIAVLRRMSVSS